MPCSNLRFLVVEDHLFQRQAAVELLTRLGAAEVLVAEDGRAALKLLGEREQAIDIVVSDLSMPGVDGLELVRRLGEGRSAVSLVIASALEAPLIASAANIARAYGVEVLGALAKPLSAVKLTPLVELHRRRGREPRADAAFGYGQIAEAWRRGDFEPWFEPCVEMATQRVAGASARARWRHPQHGTLPADRFLAAIRAAGLEDDLAWLTLQKGMAQCARWQSAGWNLPLRARLPGGGLDEAELAARVQQLAASEGVQPGRVVLGVPEGLLSGASAQVFENLTRLRMFGFGLALQDFGSGAMEIERIGMVPWTELAIQDTVVARAEHDEAARAVVAFGLQTAQQLGVAASGCGVASGAQWELLADWGCTLAEGPFVAPAMPPDEWPRWLRQWPGATTAREGNTDET